MVHDVKNKILAKYNTPGNTYHELKTAYLMLTAQHRNAATVLSRYIGGIYVDRAVIGQPGATRPFTPVALADQKRAMDALAKYVLSPNAFDMPSGLYNHLQEQRRGFGFSRAPEDPKIHDRVIRHSTARLQPSLTPHSAGPPARHRALRQRIRTVRYDDRLDRRRLCRRRRRSGQFFPPELAGLNTSIASSPSSTPKASGSMHLAPLPCTTSSHTKHAQNQKNNRCKHRSFTPAIFST